MNSSISSPLIELKNLSKKYSSSEIALNQINLKIQQGESIALMGESGAGKTSLLNILALIDEPSEGEYFFEGSLVSKHTDDERTLLRRKKLGFVFQFFNLLPSLTVSENIAIPLHLNGIKKTREAVEEKLEQIGMLDFRDRPINTLSGGQMQRIAIARALVHKPKLILADELTGSLDSKTATDILEILFELKLKENFTLIMATHSHQVALYADSTLRIVDGSFS